MAAFVARSVAWTGLRSAAVSEPEATRLRTMIEDSTTTVRSTPPVRRIAERTEQQRHVVVRLSCGRLERDQYLRIERADPLTLEVRTGVESQAIQPWVERPSIPHQLTLSAVRVSRTVPQNLPAGLLATFEHDRHADRGSAPRRIEH